MEGTQLFLLVVTGLCFFCTGASWLLQFVAYPTYLLVGDKEFVPFHVDFGKRLLIIVAPMILTCLAMIATIFIRPERVPVWMALIVAACGAIILGTTIALEVPKHQQLDKEGKSNVLINGLVRDNLPRTISWTLSSLVLAAMLAM